jgi:hypothetical protein
MINAIVRDVYEALREGRKATRKPRFSCPRGRRPRIKYARVVWNRTESRAYVLRGIRDERGSAWVVVTCLHGGDAE